MAPLRILSFGAGVQSSYVARASLIGELPPFDHVIFADTGDEPAAVYENVEWWRDRFSTAVVQFHKVGNTRPGGTGSIAADTRASLAGESAAGIPIPVFIRRSDGGKGITRRQCTGDYKVAPILRRIRELVGVAGRRHKHISDELATQTLGISWDEATRMRDAPYPWLRHEYPLVDREITRAECWDAIHRDADYPTPPRSACYHCPFRSDASWRQLRDSDPDAFQAAVDLDADLRRDDWPNPLAVTTGRRDLPYLHRSLTPLGEIDFDNSEDKGQGTLFDQECEGMCGI